MKTSIFALTLVLFGLNLSTAYAEDKCFDALSKHVEEIDSSEAYLAELGDHSKEITSFEITQMQKKMTKRYLSLKNFTELYNDKKDEKKAECTPKVLATAVAIYDYSRVGKSVFSNTVLRRVFLGFSKYTRYQLTDYIANYKKFTSNQLMDEVQLEIKAAGVILPAGVAFHKSQLDYDPNLFALSDAAIKGTTSIVAGAARVWGFISDHLKWRQGRIKNNEEAVKILKSTLRPLDLVFETRKFTLSNFTIPGHWGHVGVWLGTKEELIELGIWDQEYFAPFREFVEAGQNIVEIRKEGLNFQGIETFINLDEIAVTRIKDISTRANAVFEGLSEQIGKKYDFKFDARTADKITCAELISFSYGDIKWPETKTFFQVSLRPDDLAVLTLDASSPAEFVLYFKGIKQKDGGGFESMNYEQWSKLFKLDQHLFPEDVIAENEKKAQKKAEAERLRLEREEYNKMYGGA